VALRETLSNVVLSFHVPFSVPSSVRPAQDVLDHAKSASELLGGFSLAHASREIISRKLGYTKTFHGTQPLGIAETKNFGWYPATWYHGKKMLPVYYGF
jgi:hypothetical protein